MVLVSLTPADPAYVLQKLSDRIAALESQMGSLMRLLEVGGQKAHVTSFSGGAMCTVTFDATGATAVVPFLGTGFYTPSASSGGHGGYVMDFGRGQRVFVPVSAF